MTVDDQAPWFVTKASPQERARHFADNFLEPALMQAIYEECLGILGDQPTPATLTRAVAAAARIAEEVWRDLQDESPKYDCQKGCSWCCHQTVMVTGPEVVAVAAFIRETYSPQEVRRLRALLAGRTEEIAGHSTGERLENSLACGLLDSDACSAHPARPLLCRGGFSSDVGFCEALFRNFSATLAEVTSGQREEPFLLVPKTLFNSAQLGMATAVREFGFRCPPLELTAALKIALDHPDTGDRWLADESIFAQSELQKIDGSYVTSGL
jgi:hypothetical protein